MWIVGEDKMRTYVACIVLSRSYHRSSVVQKPNQTYLSIESTTIKFIIRACMDRRPVNLLEVAGLWPAIIVRYRTPEHVALPDGGVDRICMIQSSLSLSISIHPWCLCGPILVQLVVNFKSGFVG
jgi:hypothetical protein